MKKVCFCTPTMVKPYPEMVDAGLAEVPFMKEAGFDDCWAWEIGGAYISYARALLLRKALKWFGDEDGIVVYVDHDLSWKPGELTRLVLTPGDVVAGTYRFKSPKEEYMGRLDKLENEPIPPLNTHGCLPAFLVPAGFLKLSRNAVEMIVEKYPRLNFSRDHKDGDHHYDIFQHGVINKTWFGEDYAFSLRWKVMGNPIWLIPDLDITHWGVDHDGKRLSFPGNYAKFLEDDENKKDEVRKGRIIYEDEKVAIGDQALGVEVSEGASFPKGKGDLWPQEQLEMVL